jgi:SAM-dependent MidA family methyltransferase
LWHLNRQNALDGAGLEYWILEPSATRRAVQQSALAAFSGHVRWFEGWNSLPAMGVAGVIFSNELLDAFPVHRLGWDAQARVWFEWGVGMEGGQCQWARVPRSECGAMKLARDWLRYSGLVDGSASKEVTDPSCNALFGMLPDGYILEASPLAWQWWAMAAKTLQAGWLLTFDYGFQVEELLSPLRTQGTLRAYHRHQLSQNILDQPGEQDLTASINFSMLQFIAEKAGLKMTLNGTQSLFLSQIVSRTLKKGGEQLPWDAQRLRQFHTLAHPDHLGEALKVAVFQTQDRQLKSE